jgi:hypothetical protein
LLRARNILSGSPLGCMSASDEEHR